jgi:hypothetical protein
MGWTMLALLGMVGGQRSFQQWRVIGRIEYRGNAVKIA